MVEEVATVPRYCIEGFLFSPKVKKDFRDGCFASYFAMVILLAFCITLFLNLIKEKIVAGIIICCFFLILSVGFLLVNIRLMQQSIKYKNTKYICDISAAKNLCNNENRQIVWENGFAISQIESVEKPTMRNPEREQWHSYLALWHTGEKPPKTQEQLLIVLDSFEGIILPNTPEIQEFLSEYIHIQDIPSFPKCAIRTAQKKQWEE